MEINLVDGLYYKEEVLSLFKEYTDLLLSLNPEFEKYLIVQHYDDEVSDIKLKYSHPFGRLYLALLDNRAIGCIALRKLDENRGEVKRLFVRPEGRGMHIASFLLRRIIEDAKAIGYKELYLDTIPNFSAAIALYKKNGFVECERYNDSPKELPTLFFKKSLV